MGWTMRRVSAAVLTQLLIQAKVVTDLVNKRAKDRGVELMKVMVNGPSPVLSAFDTGPGFI